MSSVGLFYEIKKKKILLKLFPFLPTLYFARTYIYHHNRFNGIPDLKKKKKKRAAPSILLKADITVVYKSLTVVLLRFVKPEIPDGLRKALYINYNFRNLFYLIRFY